MYLFEIKTVVINYIEQKFKKKNKELVTKKKFKYIFFSYFDLKLKGKN